MGADKAVHLVDDALHGSDALATSYALAQALEQTGFDLVILGSESTDARIGVRAGDAGRAPRRAAAHLRHKVDVDGDARSRSSG